MSVDLPVCKRSLTVGLFTRNLDGKVGLTPVLILMLDCADESLGRIMLSSLHAK